MQRALMPINVYGMLMGGIQNSAIKECKSHAQENATRAHACQCVMESTYRSNAGEWGIEHGAVKEWCKGNLCHVRKATLQRMLVRMT
eukprot:1146497-Pelagomonas_calceolata.AAC.1